MTVIPFTLELLEPVLVTEAGGDPNTDKSRGFIPGSALRGALAARYWEWEQASKEIDDTFTRLFLNGQVRYLNAYPTGTHWRRALPTPKAWVQAKDAAGGQVHDLTRDAPSGQTTSLKGSFIEIDSNQVKVPEIRYRVAIHTARNRPKGRAIEGDPASAVYRYQALAPGQSFAAAILIESEQDADAQTLHDLLAGGNLYIGGSQSAGYGLVRVAGLPAIDKLPDLAAWREAPGAANAIAAGQDYAVLALSDLIVRDGKSGRETADLGDAALPWLRGHELMEAFINMNWVGGFNTTWGLPLPQSWAISQGSVWLFQAKAGLSAADVSAAERAGVGERLAEGFGRIAIYPLPLLGAAGPLVAVDTPMPAALPSQGAVLPNGTADRLLGRMAERLVRQELDRLVVVAAQNKARARRGYLSRSQLARVRLRILRQADKADFSGFQRYLEFTHLRKSSNDQFSKFSIGRDNFRAWLEALAQAPSQVWQEILGESHERQENALPQLGATPFNFRTQELTHAYTIRLISAVCEQLARDERER